jgi:hypothetical protein
MDLKGRVVKIDLYDFGAGSDVGLFQTRFRKKYTPYLDMFAGN